MPPRAPRTSPRHGRHRQTAARIARARVRCRRNARVPQLPRPVLNPIVYAIPVFFLLMGIEWAVARARGSDSYRLGDSVASIGLGTVSQMLGLYSKAIFFGIYVLAFEALRLTTLPLDSAWTWIAAVVVYDFCYYWQHRLSHRVGVLWASHVVHHQSEEFNLGTALRQTGTSFVFGWVFYLPMALLGFPPLAFGVAALIDLLYQYWIHTEQIGRLGWFDRVFASPSNHRVHHGVNDRYLDRNYGGILILWDRLFGTFVEEDAREPVVYGTRAPLRSFDPLWANLEVYVALARDSWRTRRWVDKLRVWLAPPGWRPADLEASDPKPPFRIEARQKYAPRVSSAVGAYGFVQSLLVVIAATHVLAVESTLSSGYRLLAVAWVCVSLWSVCGLLQGRSGLLVLEAARLGLPLGLLLATGGWLGAVLPGAATVAVGGIMVASLAAALLLLLARQHPRLAADP
jgi:sterol desaturase/sphingolipid hydroxylase (fatty acid hydroxylase superfamily)